LWLFYYLEKLTSTPSNCRDIAALLNVTASFFFTYLRHQSINPQAILNQSVVFWLIKQLKQSVASWPTKQLNPTATD
jgi:hypothetical protein